MHFQSLSIKSLFLYDYMCIYLLIISFLVVLAFSLFFVSSLSFYLSTLTIHIEWSLVVFCVLETGNWKFCKLKGFQTRSTFIQQNKKMIIMSSIHCSSLRSWVCRLDPPPSCCFVFILNVDLCFALLCFQIDSFLTFIYLHRLFSIIHICLCFDCFYSLIKLDQFKIQY